MAIIPIRLALPAVGEQRLFAVPPAMLAGLARLGRKAHLRPYRFDHQHTGGGAQRVIAVKMTRRRRGVGPEWPEHRLWRGQMPPNGVDPSLDGRHGKRKKQEG